MKSQKTILDEEARTIKDLHTQKLRALQELETPPTEAVGTIGEQVKQEKVEVKRDPNEKITFAISEKKSAKPPKKLITLDDDQADEVPLAAMYIPSLSFF